MVERNDDLLEELTGRIADGEALGWEELAADPRLTTRQLRALQVMARGDTRDWRWTDAPLQGPAPARPIKVALVRSRAV